MPESLKNLVVIALLLTLASAVALADAPLRDPTRPYTAVEQKVAASPRFVVNAIIVSSERRVAVVNGQRVAVGGSIDNATVIAIEKDQLVLETSGKRITVRLRGAAARQ